MDADVHWIELGNRRSRSESRGIIGLENVETGALFAVMHNGMRSSHTGEVRCDGAPPKRGGKSRHNEMDRRV